MKKKNTRSTGRRRQQRSTKPIVVLLLMIALCVGLYWNLSENGNEEIAADRHIEQINDVRDDGKDADYTEVSDDLSRAVASWLQKQGAVIEEVKRENRTDIRRKTGGRIYWTTRSTVVVPNVLFSKENLEKELHKSQGKAILYRVIQTDLDGRDVVEYDIAYHDTLDGVPLYLITDKLYVTAPEEKSGLAEDLKDIFTAGNSGKTEEKKQRAIQSEARPQNQSTKQTRPAEVKGKLAILIDDCGADMKTLTKLNEIPVPLTYAVMPYKDYTAESARSGYQAGRKIFVHLPMEPLNTASSEKVFIAGRMSDSKVKVTTKELLDQVPYAIGMNNHQGSMATADHRLMKDVMSVLKERGMVFVDSRTNSASVGEQTASAMGIRTSRNNLFIDNESDVSSIKARLRQGGEMAKRNGSAIVIGHCRPNTAVALREMIDELRSSGIEIVFVTDLLH